MRLLAENTIIGYMVTDMRKMSREEMKAAGLCPICGKPNSDPDKCRCPECRERGNRNRRENKKYLKQIGMCVRCGKNQAEPNKVMCYECIGKENDRYAEKGKSETAKAKDRERKRILSAERTENGLCSRCGKPKHGSHTKLCGRCKGYLRMYRNNHRGDIARSERPDYGICYICGNHPIMSGKRVCKECYEARLKTIPSMLENMNNEYFKQLNYAHYHMTHQKKE